MTENTNGSVELVEAEAVETESAEDTEPAVETVDAEVVSDEVETEAKPKRSRSRKQKAEGEVEVREVATPEPVEEKSSFTRAKAAKFTEKLRTTVVGAAELFIEAYNGRIWLALDYQSWADYLNAELGELRPRLPKAQRLELVAALKTEAKMSQTAIADALGVDQKTVSNDLRELRDSGEEVSETSVGQDGKEYSATAERASRRRPLVERVSAVFDRLDKAFGDLTELEAEDEWEDELGAIANRHRSDVVRGLSHLRALQDSFNSAPEFEPEVEAAVEG